MAEERCVRDLSEGDVLLFGPIGRVISYCVPSDIDPVYLIGFKDGDEPPQIAKAPNDIVLIAN